VTDGGTTPSAGHRALPYEQLSWLECGGLVANLQLQPRYPLRVDSALIATYIADFSYEHAGAIVVEDCKGVRTPVYRLKRRLMRALYGIEIVES